MTELKMEHVLMVAIIAIMLYHLMGRCGCTGNGFRVGGEKNQKCSDYPKESCGQTCYWTNDECVERTSLGCRPIPRYQGNPLGNKCDTIPISECDSDDYCQTYLKN